MVEAGLPLFYCGGLDEERSHEYILLYSYSRAGAMRLLQTGL